MQKTKLGISVGLLGAAVYFTGLFDGYLVAIILTGYVLLAEGNEWLRKNTVKAVALLICFSFLSTAINLLPDLLGFINNICEVFNGSFYIAIISKIVNVIWSALAIIRKVLFLVLGLKALHQGSVALPVVDKLIDKYM